MDRAKGRDPEAWRKIVDLYGPFLYTWCRRWGIGPSDARDVSQEVFRSVAVGIGRFRRDRAGSSFRGWLWTIARNKARDYFAARGKRPEAVGGSEMQVRLAEIPDSTGVDPPSGEPAACMRRALELIRGDFQQQTWQAFWRTTIEGRSASDVALDLGMNKAAVRQAKHRVLARLRDEFGQLID